MTCSNFLSQFSLLKIAMAKHIHKYIHLYMQQSSIQFTLSSSNFPLKFIPIDVASVLQLAKRAGLGLAPLGLYAKSENMGRWRDAIAFT